MSEEAVTVAAQQRYSSAVATIQVREVPEDSYDVLRRRARRSGQSIQAYMREQVIALARRPSPEELVEAVDQVWAEDGGRPPSRAVVRAAVRADQADRR